MHHGFRRILHRQLYLILDLNIIDFTGVCQLDRRVHRGFRRILHRGLYLILDLLSREFIGVCQLDRRVQRGFRRILHRKLYLILDLISCDRIQFADYRVDHGFVQIILDSGECRLNQRIFDSRNILWTRRPFDEL